MVELLESNIIMPIIGKFYRLRNDPKLGDYSGGIVEIENGPRNIGLPNEQYLVNWGEGTHWSYHDWIDTTLFINSVEVERPNGWISVIDKDNY